MERGHAEVGDVAVRLRHVGKESEGVALKADQVHCPEGAAGGTGRAVNG